MAEFVYVIHQTKRICKSVNGNCGKCLLGAFSCPNNARFDSTDEKKFIVFANAVMTWATEHPEPVYPTWRDLFERMGANIRCDGTVQFQLFAADKPIPADIAKKLGIEPKEG